MILDQLPHIYWINLDRSIDRRNHMLKLLEGYQNTRISAIDGQDEKQLRERSIINSHYSLSENACLLSHLIAMEHLIHSEDEMALIMEDDVTFEYLRYIPFNWSDLMKSLPENYEVIQLSISHQGIVDLPYLVNTTRNFGYYGSGAYLIHRQSAEKILEKYQSTVEGIYDFSKIPNATADYMIINTDSTWSIPIFSYQVNESIINPAHLKYHQQSKLQQLAMWLVHRQIDREEFIRKYLTSS